MTRPLIVAFVASTALVCAALAAGQIYGSPGSLLTPEADIVDAVPAPGERPQQAFTGTVDGQSWSLLSFRNRKGQLCAGETVPNDGGEGGQGLSCRNVKTLFDDAPLVYFVGSRILPNDYAHWANVWVWGFASSRIARLELQLTDCTNVRLPIDENRLFFHVTGKLDGRTAAPQQLRGYDKVGALIASEPTPVAAPDSPRARAAGTRPPARSECV